MKNGDFPWFSVSLPGRVTHQHWSRLSPSAGQLPSLEDNGKEAGEHVSVHLRTGVLINPMNTI